MNLQWIPETGDRGSAVLSSSRLNFKATLEGSAEQIMPLMEIMADYLENRLPSKDVSEPVAESSVTKETA